MLTGAAYRRRSKKSKEGDVSLDVQTDAIEAMAAREGIEIVKWFTDEVSGGKGKEDRPGWSEWLEQAGEVDFLLAYMVSRSSRQGLEGAVQLGRIPEQTDTVVLTCDGLDSRNRSAFEWALIIKSQVALEERRAIQQRAIDTRARLIKEGRHPAGAAPFGTKVVDKVLVIDDEESAIVRGAGMRLLSGLSMRAVLRWLNEELAVTTRRGKQWTRSSLTGTLESASSRALIFTLAEGRALDERLHANGTPRPKGGRPATWLLARDGQCRNCGGPLTTTRAGGAPRYQCRAKMTGAVCPRPVTIRADHSDAEVERRYLERYGDVPYWEEVVTIEGQDLDEAERAYEAAKAKAAETWADEDVATAREAQEAFRLAQSRPVVRRRSLQWNKTYGEQWAEADKVRRWQILWDFAASITVASMPETGSRTAFHPDRIEIVWKDEIEDL